MKSSPGVLILLLFIVIMSLPFYFLNTAQKVHEIFSTSLSIIFEVLNLMRTYWRAIARVASSSYVVAGEKAG